MYKGGFPKHIKLESQQIWVFHLFSSLYRPDYFGHIVLFITIFKMLSTFLDFWNAKAWQQLTFLVVFQNKAILKKKVASKNKVDQTHCRYGCG